MAPKRTVSHPNVTLSRMFREDPEYAKSYLRQLKETCEKYGVNKEISLRVCIGIMKEIYNLSEEELKNGN